ncbi:MAG: PhoH family protein [Luminiphilus sp.]|nr:PhoH family protein [Luminiphilus sp.]
MDTISAAPEPDSTSEAASQLSITLEPNDARHLAALCGQLDAHLRQLEERLGVVIRNRSNQFTVSGNADAAAITIALLETLYGEAGQGIGISPESVHLHLQQADLEHLAQHRQQNPGTDVEPITVIRTKRTSIKPRGKNQQAYVRALQRYDINFGIGPAGTGKTYLGVACAVQALLDEQVRRILLVRPAVEAGERLGFLPGDLSQKVDPYLRPLYDALYEMLGFETVTKYIERNIIEVAPLAFMRGRTLNNAFIILDEAQNTTREQMKMFLTRIGFGSTAVITGDATQIDLPRGQQSGLIHATQVLEGVEGITFTWFANKDVVRHPLVQRVVSAYDEFEARSPKLERREQ